MNSAQQAALAAFRAKNQPKEQPQAANSSITPEQDGPSRKTQLTLRQSGRNSELVSSKANRAENLTKEPKCAQAKVIRRLATPDLKLRIDTSVAHLPSLASLATAAAELSSRHHKSNASESNYLTPTARTPAALAAAFSERSSQMLLPRSSAYENDSSSGSLYHEDSSVPNQSSSDGQGTTNPLRLRISVTTDPKKMVEKMKQSINSKTKSGVAKKSAERSKAALNEFRQTVDLKRYSTPVPTSHNESRLFGALNSELQRSQSSLDLRFTDESLPSFEHPFISIKDLQDLNNSRISVESYVSGSESETPVTPSIAVVDTDEEGALKAPSEAPGKSVQPIAVPPSPNAVARSTAVGGPNGAELIAHLSLNSLPNLSDVKVEEKKARRKPPPDMEDENTRGSLERSASNVLSGVDENGESKFPQYPDIPEKKKKKRGLFKKSKHNHSACNTAPQERLSFEQTNANEVEETPPPENPRSGISPVVANPHIALKTTMRKAKKKKAFDENKPWKNHESLDGILESERKRYEGVWASNKGLYMDKVVTRLVGVDYNKDYGGESELRKNFDPLLLAAKLSTAAEEAASENTENHIIERHNLKHADPHELIHGLVVKQIWERSGLPPETLSQIWDLVDFRKDGTLNKIEFLVGMWLVDQCLYGRKLPKKVEELVWSSLGNIGINVVIRKKKTIKHL